MQKLTLAAAAFVLIAFGGIAASAQNTEKKETGKTAVDAWRDALPPQSEQPAEAPVVVMEESTDRVESRESAAQIEKRILDLENRLIEALKRRDAGILKNLLADDFQPAGAETVVGAQPDKTKYIDWALKNLQLKSYVAEKTAARVYPTAVIVTTHYKRQAIVAGAPADGNFVATNVWIKRAKQWQMVSSHVSASAKP